MKESFGGDREIGIDQLLAEADSGDFDGPLAYRALGLGSLSDEIVADEQVNESFRRVERADGTIERHYPDGVWIVALDGTSTVWRPDGTATIFRFDGGRTEVDSEGALHEVRFDGLPLREEADDSPEDEGELVIEMASGARVVAEPEGDRRLELPDGSVSVSRADGTVERTTGSAKWTTGIDGTTTIVRSDGTASTLHPDGSRTDVSDSGEVTQTDSQVHLTLTDDQPVEAPSRRPVIVPAVVAVAVVLGVVGIWLLVRDDDGTSFDPQVIEPEAAEVLRGIPQGFDVDAWCGDVGDALDAGLELDELLVSGASATQVEDAARVQARAVERAADGAPDDLVELWALAPPLAEGEVTVLSEAGWDLDKLLAVADEAAFEVSETLDIFLLEQNDACIARLVDPA